MLIAALRVWGGKNSAKRAGKWVYGDPLFLYEAIWDVEVCLPFAGDLPEDLPSNVYAAALPGGQVASALYEGDYGGVYGMQGAYTAVWRWMQEHGLAPASPPCEVYLLDHQNADQPQDYRTEIAWMVQRLPRS